MSRVEDSFPTDEIMKLFSSAEAILCFTFLKPTLSDEPSDCAMLPASELSAHSSALSYERRMLAAKLFLAALQIKSAKRMSADIITPLRRSFPTLFLKGAFVFFAKLTPPCFYCA